MALNKIILQGRLTKTPELRQTPGGNSVTGFTLAVERDVKNKETGERDTDFVEVVVWGKSAEFVSKYFTKGQMALVEGRLQVRDWMDKDGNKRRSAEVVAQGVYLTGSKGESAPTVAKQAGNGYGDGGQFKEIQDDGDLPF